MQRHPAAGGDEHRLDICLEYDCYRLLELLLKHRAKALLLRLLFPLLCAHTARGAPYWVNPVDHCCAPPLYSAGGTSVESSGFLSSAFAGSRPTAIISDTR